MDDGGRSAGSGGSTGPAGPLPIQIAQRPAAPHILTVCV
ncbi:hypothetical protein [Azospirillum melinis]